MCKIPPLAAIYGHPCCFEGPTHPPIRPSYPPTYSTYLPTNQPGPIFTPVLMSMWDLVSNTLLHESPLPPSHATGIEPTGPRGRGIDGIDQVTLNTFNLNRSARSLALPTRASPLPRASSTHIALILGPVTRLISQSRNIMRTGGVARLLAFFGRWEHFLLGDRPRTRR
jgi:hypothetical protein